MITHLNKERQNVDIGSIETKELHKGVIESRHPQHLFTFTREDKRPERKRTEKQRGGGA